MGCVIQLDEVRQRRVIEKLIGQMGMQFEHSRSVADEFIALATQNPEQAVEQLGSFMARARDHGPDSAFGEAMGGGPCEYDTAPFLDIIEVADAPLRASKHISSFAEGLEKIRLSFIVPANN